MKIRVFAGLLAVLFTITVHGLALDITTNPGRGTVSLRGSFDGCETVPVNLAVYDKEDARIAYVNQINTTGGRFSLEFPLTSNAGWYRAVASSPFGTQSEEFYFGEKGADDAEDFKELIDRGVLQYSEGFDRTLDLWSTTGDVHIKDGWLSTDYGPGFKKAWLNAPGAHLWDNQLVSFRFRREDIFGASRWSGIELCRQDDGRRHLLFLGPDYTSAQLMDGTDHYISDYRFEENQPYDVTIVAKNDTISIYAKPVWQEAYTFLGSVAARLVRGGFGFAGWNVETSIDELKIYDLNERVLAGRKPLLLEAGDTTVLPLHTHSGQTRIWSDNPAVAAVNQDGFVYTKAAGAANLWISDGETADCIPLRVADQLKDFTLSAQSVFLEAGEAESIAVNTGRFGGAAPRLIWSNSNDAVISLFGGTDLSKTIVAKKAGSALITVSDLSARVLRSCVVTVTEPGQTGTKCALLKVSGQYAQIPDKIFGMFQPQAGYVNVSSQHYHGADPGLYRALGVQLLRGPDGGYSNVYRWRTGDLSNRPLEPGYQGFFISDAYKIPNELDLPYCFAVNVTGQTAADIADQVREIRKNTSKTIYLELGNEVYDMGYMDVFPSPADYVNKCRDIYQAVKNADGNVKVGIVITTDWLAVRLRSVPYIYNWNKTIALNPDCYDAVIPHYYSSIDNMHAMTAREMMEALAAYNAELRREQLAHSAQFPGKEIWVTEYGVLLSDLYRQENVRENNRLQISKTPGIAIRNMEMLLDMIKGGKVHISAYNQAIADSGFGVAQRNGGELAALPMFHTFSKVGELLADFDYCFGIEPEYVNTRTVNADYIYNGCKETIPSVSAWGFGTDESIMKAVISNHASEAAEVRLDGYDLSVQWRYGSANPLGEKYLQGTDYWCGIPQELETPETFDEDFSSSILLPPYTVAVCALSRNTAQPMFAGLDIGDGNLRADQAGAVCVILDGGGYAPEFEVSSGGAAMASSVTREGDRYYVSVSGGYLYGRHYKIKLTAKATGETKTFQFRVKDAPVPKSDFTAQVWHADQRLHIRFSAAPDMETLRNIRLLKNAAAVEYDITAVSGREFIIVPSGGVESGAYYSLSCDERIRSAAGKALAAPVMGAFLSGPVVDERFDDATALEITGDAWQVKDGVLAHKAGRSGAVFVTRNSGRNYRLEFDMGISDGYLDCIKLLIGASVLKFGVNGVKIQSGGAPEKALGRYDFSGQGPCRVSVGVSDGFVTVTAAPVQGGQAEPVARAFLSPAEDLAVAFEAVGDAFVDRVTFFPLPDAQMKLRSALAEHVLFQLDFEGAVNPESVNDGSVFLLLDGRVTDSALIKREANQYLLSSKNTVSGGTYQAYVIDSAHHLYGVPVFLRSSCVVVNTFSDYEIYARLSKFYLENNGDFSEIEDMEGGRIHSVLEIANDSLKDKRILAVCALYEKGEGGSRLKKLDAKSVPVRACDISEIKFETLVPDGGKEYEIKILLLNGMDHIRPLSPEKVLK